MKINQLLEAGMSSISNGLTEFPEDIPDVINGAFNFLANHITSLKGGPSKVKGNFIISGNKLTNLNHGPTQVSGIYDCSFNLLTSLEQCPDVVNEFRATDNRLTNLIGSPRRIKKGEFCVTGNKLTSLEGCPEYIAGDLEGASNFQLTSLKGIENLRYVKNINFRHSKIESHLLGIFMVDIDGLFDFKFKTKHPNDEAVIIDIVVQNINKGRKGMMNAMKQLTDLGYEELAQL